jgi:HicA-like toxin of HicAB toxin-antitoxin system
MAELYRDLVRILQANGCYLVRKGKGGHEIWYSPVSKRNLDGAALDQIAPHRERCAPASRLGESFLT